MKTIEKVIRRSVSEIDKELAKIDAVLNSSPYSDIIQARIDAQELLKNNPTLEQRMSKEFAEKLNLLAEIEKEAFKMVKKQKKASELIDRKVELQHEKNQLMTQLWINQRG